MQILTIEGLCNMTTAKGEKEHESTFYVYNDENSLLISDKIMIRTENLYSVKST